MNFSRRKTVRFYRLRTIIKEVVYGPVKVLLPTIDGDVIEGWMWTNYPLIYWDCLRALYERIRYC